MQKPRSTQLPGDLPENWQLEQAISPVGTDVGLTEKHGYNYLNEQINEAHKAINELNDAFTDVQGNLEDIATDTEIVDTDTVPIVESGNTKKRISFLTLVNAIKTKFASVYAALVHSHGNLSNEGNLGTSANNAAYTSSGGKLIAGTLPVAAGGTGKTTFNAGQVLVGNGTEGLAQRAIDTTEGGTAGSNSLITSGAVKAALDKKVDTTGNAGSATKLQTPRTIALSGGATGTATSFDGSANITIPVTAVNPDNLSKATPITKGGTGAGTAPEANKNLTKRVMNTAPAEDLPSSYPEGIFVYIETSPNSQLPYKPSEFGLLLSMKGEAEVSQFWFTQPNGAIYRRGGNTAGWNASNAVPTNRGWVPVGSGSATMASAEIE